MSTSRGMSPEALTIWRQIIGASKELGTGIAHLSDTELRALTFAVGELWSRIASERVRRYPTTDSMGSDPVWAIIREAGVMLQSHQVDFRGQEVTVWTWAIPSAQITKHVDTGEESQLDALRAVLVRLVTTLREAEAEERAALRVDLTSYQGWRAVKEEAGTWDVYISPKHPDAPPDDEEFTE